ncbi:Krr1-domain-containing protein [Saitoella complicata NRRL Y-17804]|uniref:Kri1-like C-terminal domain-containing protein n=1 Tax=Saitoella complicata (strain BCRC 22490 / CBS 7301 / JCM 7358 / NBRC 10748 / NRRL Y-17804) TaxID=698492 RepID=A0A0E9NF19_SAICN|nr:Krr1-domain-containing protein [Saitoella complicata NRRL Y-17804]ODQ50907.1 Krr1-domain-containing protein [Saitoella complicata NRRL Y-17804]GAO48403.1 hypothetical protein G7K_2576-t1 [Saitoella complicata NRRL Y-17804]
MPRKKSAARKAREEAVVSDEVVAHLKNTTSAPFAPAPAPVEKKTKKGGNGFLDESDEEDLGELKINEDYAKRFQHNKEREERQRLEVKHARDLVNAEDPEDDEDSETDSEDETEDEDAELLTPAVDAAILKTIAKIRSGDKELFDKDKPFNFEEAERELQKQRKEAREKAKESKPMFLKDYHRRNLLEGGGDEDEDMADADADFGAQMREKYDMTHVQEQAKLKAEISSAFHAGAEEDEDDDDLLVARKKGNEEMADEEDGYKKFLIEAAGDEELKQWLDKAKKDKDIKVTEVAYDDEEKGEEFLMNFIMNRGWMDKDASRVPTYDEIVQEDEDEFDDRVDHFENAYNFRYEEAGAADIVGHARNITSVRRKDDKRKAARDARNERKELEKQQKLEELRRLKNLKRKEIEEKLKKIAEITGSETVPFDDVDLEGEFDPERWDRKMQEAFDDKYYEGKDTKPTFDDDIDIDDIVPEFSKKNAKNKPATMVDENGEEIIMDADYAVEGERARTSRKEKRKEILDKKRKLDDYIDNHYQLDYEDMIGDLPTRFKYRTVESEDFGLSPADILLADDTQLNEFIGLKKLNPFRTREQVMKDKRKYAKKKRLQQWRQEVFGKEVEKAQREKMRQQRAAAEAEAKGEDVGEAVEGGEENGEQSGKRKRRKKSKKAAVEE